MATRILVDGRNLFLRRPPSPRVRLHRHGPRFTPAAPRINGKRERPGPEVPELPEVETVTRSIAKLKGRRIRLVEFSNSRILRGVRPESLSAGLEGRSIQSIQRYGKFIRAGARRRISHHSSGYDGAAAAGGAAGKHTHAIFTFDRGACSMTTAGSLVASNTARSSRPASRAWGGASGNSV